MPQTQIIWAVGAFGFAVSSADGGATWSKRAVPARGDLWDVDFVSSTEGWIVSEDPDAILWTTDGGNTWTVISTGSRMKRSLDFHLLNANTGWAVGNGGSIVATQNGGTTWKKQRSGAPPDDFLFDIRFIDAMRGWAVGIPERPADYDGGATWRTQPVPPRGRWMTVFFADATHGWMVGEARLFCAPPTVDLRG